MCDDRLLLGRQAVLQESDNDEIKFYSNVIVKGFDFNEGINYHRIFESLKTTGFQATNLGFAIDQINDMLKLRDEPIQKDEYEPDPFIRIENGCTIFLGYTSNMSSSGIRDIIRFLVQHKLVDCIVTTAGGIEEDLIKCLEPTYIGDFELKGSELREKSINRIGNLLVPNSNYCKFEDWIVPILDEMLKEQIKGNVIWTPSTFVTLLGNKINNEESICYWAARNNIPIFCPAITDGSLGDMLFFHTYKNPGLVIDIVQDIRRLNSMALNAKRSGTIILGGGVVKHHICNANLMRNGSDFAVYINTGNEFDGSDSGARPDEAISWGKIKSEAKPVKVNGDATIIFPIIVAETFAKHFHYNVVKKIS